MATASIRRDGWLHYPVRTAMRFLSELGDRWTLKAVSQFSGAAPVAVKRVAGSLHRDGVLIVEVDGARWDGRTRMGDRFTMRPGRRWKEWASRTPRSKAGGGRRDYKRRNAISDLMPLYGGGEESAIAAQRDLLRRVCRHHGISIFQLGRDCQPEIRVADLEALASGQPLEVHQIEAILDSWPMRS